MSGPARDRVNDPQNVLDYIRGRAEAALDHVSVAHDITTSSDVFSPLGYCSNLDYPGFQYDTQMECLKDQVTDWLNNYANDIGADFNLMILPDLYQGQLGIGDVGGNTAIVKGAQLIEDSIDSNYPQYDSSGSRVSSALHEIGHNLSLSHAGNGENGSALDGHATLYYYSQLFSLYAVSPHGPPPNQLPIENECGELQDEVPTGSAGMVNDFYFYDGCAGNFIQEYDN